MKKFFKIVFSGLCALVIGLNVFGVFNTNTTAFAQSNDNMVSTNQYVSDVDYLNTFFRYSFSNVPDSTISLDRLVTFGDLTFYQSANNSWYYLDGNNFVSTTISNSSVTATTVRIIDGQNVSVVVGQYMTNYYALSVNTDTVPYSLTATSYLMNNNGTNIPSDMLTSFYTGYIDTVPTTFAYSPSQERFATVTFVYNDVLSRYNFSMNWLSLDLPFVLDMSRFAYINGYNYYFNPVDTYGETVDVYLFDGSTFTLITQLGFDFNDTTYNIVDSVWFDGKYYYINNYRITSDTTTFTLERVSFIFHQYTGSSYNASAYNFGSTIWSNGVNVFTTDYILYNNLYYSAYDVGYEDGYKVAYDVGYADGVAAGGSGSSYEDGYNAGYNAGVTAGSSTAYNQGYNAGYNQGTTAGYNNGYREGYDQGVINGTNTGYNQGLDVGYNNGYSEGYNNGVDVGYTDGYNEGVESANDYTFLSLIGATIDAPIKAFTGLFNFEIFGTNISGLLLALFTGSIIIVIIKFALGGK